MLKLGIHLRLLFIALTALICIPRLNAQSYQSGFSDINVDKIKSNFGYGNIVTVQAPWRPSLDFRLYFAASCPMFRVWTRSAN